MQGLTADILWPNQPDPGDYHRLVSLQYQPDKRADP
jgi:hypothetical protein